MLPKSEKRYNSQQISNTSPATAQISKWHPLMTFIIHHALQLLIHFQWQKVSYSGLFTYYHIHCVYVNKKKNNPLCCWASAGYYFGE